MGQPGMFFPDFGDALLPKAKFNLAIVCTAYIDAGTVVGGIRIVEKASFVLHKHFRAQHGLRCNDVVGLVTSQQKFFPLIHSFPFFVTKDSQCESKSTVFCDIYENNFLF